MHDADDAESAEIRAHLIGEVVRLTPALMAANLVSGTVVGALVVPFAWQAYLVWMGVLCTVVGLGWRAWWLSRRRQPRTASRRAIARSTRHAAALGALWSVPAVLWFPVAAPGVQTMLATLVAGMLSAGAFALSPLPRASTAYVGLLASGSMLGLMFAYGPASVPFVLLCAAYGGICLLGALTGSRKTNALLRSERDAERQRQIVTVLLRDFEEQASEALWETDAEGRLCHASARLGELMGAPAAGLQGLTLAEMIERRCPGGGALVQARLATGLPFRDLALQFLAEDRTLWWQLSGKPSDAGGWRGVVIDVSAKVLAEQRLRQLAHFDSLTGLANRVTLHEALRHHLAEGTRGALLSIDLDHFKTVNDTLGHSADDALLVAAAERLRRCVRPGDVVARLGGDEFAVLLCAAPGPEAVLPVAERMVAEFTQPCAVGERKIPVGLSIGIALLPEHGRDVDDVLGNADLALYESKEGGRGRATLYAPHLGERSRRRAAIEQGLREAVARGEFMLHWQPRVDLDGWRMTGAEALLRWQHPVLGRVGPAEFITVAEQTGTIAEIGAWVLREACRVAATTLPGLTVSVNVSALQLRQGDFVAGVRDALDLSGLPAARLEIELTESIFIDDANDAMAVLRRLQQLGVRIALDDFGTGYSSLAYLRRFPFDTLKIDRAFVRELTSRQDTQAIVAAMTQLATSLGMRVVAEGVERVDELDLVARLGCHEVQGYLVSVPRTETEFGRLRGGWDAGARPHAPALH